MFLENFYAGWIVEGQKMLFLERLQGGEKLESSVEGMKHFWWKHKNSNCVENILHF